MGFNEVVNSIIADAAEFEEAYEMTVNIWDKFVRLGDFSSRESIRW